MLLIIATCVALVSLWRLLRRPKHPVDDLPGPPTLPVFGNILTFMTSRDEAFHRFNSLAVKYRPLYRTWLASVPVIHLLDPNHVEVVLKSTEHITKSRDYDLIKDWLGTGLLTSSGSKWHKRRKMLTPAFHFKILEQFVPTFSDNSRTLVTKLRAHLGRPVDVVPLVTRCALDVICETAMGTKLNHQDDAHLQYVDKIYKLNDLIVHRLVRPWLYPDWIYALTPWGRKHKRYLGILHGFTKKVIQERREELAKLKLEDSNENVIQDEEKHLGIKQKVAFLDLLLQLSEEDNEMTDEDIRQEVDTFMFEGHDTTAMAMSWAIFFLGSHPEIQDKCVSELSEIFGVSDRAPTMSDLGSMKYLERVIKETLRLRPSVFLINRKLESTLALDKYEFPADTKVQIHIFNMHRDPELYPDPEKFDPDRFLPENCVTRHPYAYIPFSAGPRNCIGQKFAMLEMKSLLSTLLRNFHLESIDPEHHGQLMPDLLLRPKFGIPVVLTPRQGAQVAPPSFLEPPLEVASCPEVVCLQDSV